MTMMLAMHDALRRELVQVARAARVRNDHRGRLHAALGWELFKNFLTVHHRSEDDALLPRCGGHVAVAAGGELLLVIVGDGAVPRIFTLTCLDRFISCSASLEEAPAQAPAATTLAPGSVPGSGSPAHQPGSPDARVRADGQHA
jgi:hypothetical protein